METDTTRVGNVIKNYHNAMLWNPISGAGTFILLKAILKKLMPSLHAYNEFKRIFIIVENSSVSRSLPSVQTFYALLAEENLEMIAGEKFNATPIQLNCLFMDFLHCLVRNQPNWSQQTINQLQEGFSLLLCIATRMYLTTGSFGVKPIANKIFSIYQNNLTRLDVAKLFFQYSVTILSQLGVDIAEVLVSPPETLSRSLYGLDTLQYHNQWLREHNPKTRLLSTNPPINFELYDHAKDLGITATALAKYPALEEGEASMAAYQRYLETPSIDDPAHPSCIVSSVAADRTTINHTDPEAFERLTDFFTDLFQRIATSATESELREIAAIYYHSDTYRQICRDNHPEADKLAKEVDNLYNKRVESFARYSNYHTEITSIKSEYLSSNTYGLGPAMHNIKVCQIGAAGRLKINLMQRCEAIHSDPVLFQDQIKELLKIALDTRLLDIRSYTFQFSQDSQINKKTASRTRVEHWTEGLENAPQARHVFGV